MAEENKKDVGRPPELTEDKKTNFAPRVLRELEDAFLDGMNNREACFIADISERAFYEVLQNNPELAQRFDLLKENLKVQSKKVIAKAIKNDDKQQANWYLERKSKDEFSLRNELTGADGEKLQPVLVKFLNEEKDGKDTDNRNPAGV